MQYDLPLYRPPSEADSLILQVTLGCSWNRCLFCGMYKEKRYSQRDLDAVAADIREMAAVCPETRRVFLADGDALGADTAFLAAVLELLNEKFPQLERVSMYAGPTNLARKSVAEMQQLAELGLKLIYVGLETGNDDLLKKICKGTDAAGFIAGCLKAKAAGIGLSTIILLGLGGVEMSRVHAKDSARMVNAINPDFLACLTLMLGPYKEVYEEKLMGGGFRLPDSQGVLQELRWLVEDLEVDHCRFGTEHASNYLPIGGSLPQDKEQILSLIDKALDNPARLRPEWLRGL